jgi:hypothetical protein
MNKLLIPLRLFLFGELEMRNTMGKSLFFGMLMPYSAAPGPARVAWGPANGLEGASGDAVPLLASLVDLVGVRGA